MDNGDLLDHYIIKSEFNNRKKKQQQILYKKEQKMKREIDVIDRNKDLGIGLEETEREKFE